MKPGTFTQLYIHLVFSPKGRQSHLHPSVEGRVYEYIQALLKNQNHHPFIINGMPDHIHILVGLNPSTSISDLVRNIKRSSTLFINANKLIPERFQWQDGYGAFSYGKSQVDRVYDYIRDQKEHHNKMGFHKEYTTLLDRFGIPFDPKFLFQFYDD